MPRYDDDSDLEPAPRRRRRPARRKSDSGTTLIVLSMGFAVLFLACAAVGVYVIVRGKTLTSTAAGDLERLAGSWESSYQDATGRVTMYKVKQIVGTNETVTWYRPDGTVFRVNRVEFELVQRGPDKVFRYFNGWATEASGVTQPFPSGEYVYTLEGDTWTEYDPGGVIVWTRRR
jgi:hypothetical protein